MRKKFMLVIEADSEEEIEKLRDMAESHMEYEQCWTKASFSMIEVNDEEV